MASIGTAYFKVAPNLTGVQGKIASGLRGSGTTFSKQFGTEISGKSAAIIGALAGVAQAATQKAMTLIANSIGDAVRRVDTLKAAQRTFAFMGFRAKDASEATKKLTDSILGLPTPLDSAMRGMTMLAATYQDVKLGQKVFSSLNNAILGFGGTADMVNNAILQLSQVPLDGPLDAQTWNSLRNSGLTPVLVAMSKGMGKSMGQMKAEFGDGILTVQDFVDALTKMNTEGGGGLASLEKIAKSATEGIGTGIANMQTAVSRGIANIIESIGAKNISSAIAAFGNAFEKVLTSIAKVLGDADVQIAIVITAVGGLAFAFYALAPAVWAALSPILPFVAAFVGLVAVVKLVRANWSKIAPIINTVKTAFKALYDLIVKGDFTAAFRDVFKLPEDSPIVDFILKLRRFVIDNVKQIFESIGSIAKQAAQNLKPLIDGFKSLMANKTVQKVLKAIGIALLAIVAAPIVIFIAAVVAGITILSKVLGFLADHFNVIKVILAIVFAPLIAAVVIVVAAVKLIIATVKILINVFNMVKGAIVAVFNAIATVWNSVLKPVFSVMINIVKTILAIYIKVWAFIALVIVGTMAIIASVIFNVMKKIWGIISAIWNAVYKVISAIVSRIAAVIVRVWNFYYGIISTVLGRVWGVVSSVWNKVYGFISRVLGTIGRVVGSAWRSIYGTISGIVRNIWSSVSGTFNRVVSFVGGIGGRILRAVGNFGGLLYDKGRSLVQGLLDGAGSLLSSIGQFFLDKLPGWIQGPFKKALGIASPSKVFRAYGRYIGAGLINGLSDKSNEVKKQAAKLANKAIAGATNALKGLQAKFSKVVNEIAGSIKQSSGILNIEKFTDPDNFVSGLESQLTAIRKFRSDLQTLRARGLGAQTIAEIAGAGVEQGGKIANVLSTASAATLKQINSLNSQIGSSAKAVGKVAGNAMYGAGINTMQGLLRGMKAKKGAIIQLIARLGDDMKKTLKRKLGIKSPSKVFAGFGINIAQGLSKGIVSNQSMVQRAVTGMTNKALAGVTTPLSNPSAFRAGAGSGGAGSGDTTHQIVTIDRVVLGDQSAVKEFFKQLNQDTINIGKGLTPIQGDR